MVTFTAEAMIFAKVVVPIVVWILENILALGAAVIGCIFIFVVILGIGKLLLDGLASAGSGGEGSGQSASSFEAGGSSGYSESRSEKDRSQSGITERRGKRIKIRITIILPIIRKRAVSNYIRFTIRWEIM